jgi:hypothetical protein
MVICPVCHASAPVAQVGAVTVQIRTHFSARQNGSTCAGSGLTVNVYR